VISYEWRGPFTSAEASVLHAEAFGHRDAPRNWREQVERHSLGWVCARDGADLAGFVNLAWDGGAHAFILDTMVAARMHRQGIGISLVALAVQEARRAGCAWLHVDFEEHLHPFYIRGCGFTPTSAGLVALAAHA
jgi:GNAT superfamily N-acetyltransferase